MASNHLPVSEAVKNLEVMIPKLNKAQLIYLESLLGSLYHKIKDQRQNE